MEEYNETELLSRIGVTKAKKNELLKAIDDPVTRSFIASEPDIKLLSWVAMARAMTMRIENEAAIQVIKAGIKESLRVERFDLTVEFLEIGDLLTEPYQFVAPAKAELILLQQNVLSYQL